MNELTRWAQLLLPSDFKAFSKLKAGRRREPARSRCGSRHVKRRRPPPRRAQVHNNFYNVHDLPIKFKFKEYCPLVFDDLRRRFGYTSENYRRYAPHTPQPPRSSPLIAALPSVSAIVGLLGE